MPPQNLALFLDSHLTSSTEQVSHNYNVPWSGRIFYYRRHVCLKNGQLTRKSLCDYTYSWTSAVVQNRLEYIILAIPCLLVTI